MNTHEKLDFRTRILEQVKGIVLDQLSGHTASVYLFGSWARGEEKRSSDIDIAIEFQSSQAMFHESVMRIRDVLEESTVPYKVDVVLLNTADEIIVSKVRKEGIVWGDSLKE